MAEANLYPDPANPGIAPANADIAALLRQDGSLSHEYFTQLLEDSSSSQAADLADIAHFFCLMHGRFPGVIDYAAGHSPNEHMREWLVRTGEAFAAERALLTKLTVAAGPIVSTVGQDQCNNVVIGARNALDMLAQSDRNGCAFGAAIALAIDWISIRQVLGHIALRVGLEARPLTMPTLDECHAFLSKFDDDAVMRRAIIFGITQMMAQHRAIWDLMESRHDNRVELLI